MGISVISHPKNPHIPTSHMNVRIFAILDQNNDIADWWVGGGYDLTPFLPYEEDIIQWHSSAKAALEPFGKNFYEDFSNNCNKYFEIPHRNERRGVGGIFFDDLTDFTSINESMKFLKSVAECYVDSYSNIINKRNIFLIEHFMINTIRLVFILMFFPIFPPTKHILFMSTLKRLCTMCSL